MPNKPHPSHTMASSIKNTRQEESLVQSGSAQHKSSRIMTPVQTRRVLSWMVSLFENHNVWMQSVCICERNNERWVHAQPKVNSAAPISYLVDPQGCQIVARVVGGDLRIAHLRHPQSLLGIFSAADFTFQAQDCGQKRARDDELHAAQANAPAAGQRLAPILWLGRASVREPQISKESRVLLMQLRQHVDRNSADLRTPAKRSRETRWIGRCLGNCVWKQKHYPTSSRA